MNKHRNKSSNKKSNYPAISPKFLKIAKDILKEYSVAFKELASK